MKRKILSLILAFAMTVSLLTVGTGAVEPTYGDTAGHWAESSIERWSAYGIIQGSNGQFDPNGQLTCAQLATILAKLLKLPAAKDAGFTDNTADAWYYDAINRCAAAGILNGNGDGTVTPEAPITRERAMVMLARALGIEPIRKPDLTKYTDAAQVSAYAQGYVAALIEAGIVGGVTADELAPQDNINRASTVTILDRAISTYADKAGATVKVDGKGLVLVVAKNVKITGAPEGTKIVVADGATGLTVNGKSVSDDQTYIVPKTTTSSGSSSSGGYSHTHTWSDWTTTKAPTCAETGTKTRICTVCDQIETAAIDKLDHRAGAAATCTTAQFCTVCGEKLAEALGHDWEVTSTENKCSTTITNYKCKNCNETKAETAEGGSHTATEVTAIAATCTTAGTTAGTKCSTCGVILSGCETIPALGHDFADAWTTTDDTNHWHACTRCDAKSMETAHDYGEVVTDWTAEDLKTGKTCSVCEKFVDLSGENTYYIATIADLQAFAAKVNGGNKFSGKTVKLTTDISLKNEPWTPIGNTQTAFCGTFDGNSKTIFNLTVTSASAAGLFGYMHGKVQNLTVKNAIVNGNHWAGVIAGYSTANNMTISNCHVSDSSVTVTPELVGGNYDNGDKAGGIIGYCVYGDTVTGCSVTNTTVKAYRDIGGIVGCALGEANTTANITSNRVENVTLIQDRTNGYGENTDTSTIAAIVGRFNDLTGTTGSTATNVTYVVGSSKALERVIALDEENLSIVLGADVTVDTKPYIQKPFGGESTKTITVDGQKKYTLTFNNTNNDWNNIVLKNTDAKLILKNMTIDNSNYGAETGPWNNHDIVFDCKVELQNVIALNSIALEKDAKLTRVSIEDPTCGQDTYVLWIVANGQTVELNNCVINGKSDVGKTNRAIKISDEYVRDPKSVTLDLKNVTISSDKYAAVYVGSKGGANITYSDVDNAATAENSSLVGIGISADETTPSGPVYVNGTRLIPAGTQEQVNKAVKTAITSSEAKDVKLALPKDSTFTLDNGLANEGDKSRNVTFVGDGTQTVDVAEKAPAAEGATHLNYQRGSTFTFENVTIQAGEGNFDGIVCNELAYKDCTIKGKLTLYGKATFVNCTFENEMANQYSIWTWGGTDVTFENCTFNTNGKAILLYGQATAEKPTNLTVSSCTFNDRNNGSAGKAAIEIGNDYNATYNLTVTKATVNGFADGKNTGSKLWANKNSMDATHLSVTIDGTKVVL